MINREESAPLFLADFSVLPLFPGLIALCVMGYALLLAGTAGSTYRFLIARDATSPRESIQVALFTLGCLIAQLPLALPAIFTALPYLGRAGWALAVFSALLLPGNALPGLWRIAPILLGLFAVAYGDQALSPLLGAAVLYLFLARTAQGLQRRLRLGMGLLLLAAAGAGATGPLLAAALQSALLAGMVLLLWSGADITRRSLGLLSLGLFALPLLLVLAGQGLLLQEEAFRSEQRNEAHLRLELVKSQLDGMNTHGLDLLKILATDQVTQSALGRPQDDHDFAFRLLARRVSAQSVFLLDRTGRPLATSDPALKTRVFAQAPYFLKAMQGVSNAHYLHGAALHQAGVYYARPLLDRDAELAAVIVARFDLDEVIGDSVRMDDVIMHRQGVILLGPGELRHGALFDLSGAERKQLAAEIVGLNQLPSHGYRIIDGQWVRDRAGTPWMWASIPLPGGVWQLGKKVSAAPLLEYRHDRMLLLMLVLSVLLLLGLYALQNGTFVHLLLREVEQRRHAEASEREAREEVEASNLELTRHRLHLETLVAERTRELEELNRSLDQRVRDEITKRKQQESLLIHQSRLAAMGEMIAAIAHQWRQPLNALSLVLQNIHIQHQMGALSEQSMQRMQDKAEQLVQRMSSTIDEFRNFFKPRTHPETFNLAHAMQSAAGILEGVFRNHGIELVIECDQGINLVGIPGEFSQVLLNLLGNAKDAVLDSRQAAPTIRLRAARDGNSLKIDVEDNGGGISPDIIDKIFEPYFTTKEEGKGSGIGLYMSKMIVENNMNGRLAASNTPEGARFSILLPTLAASESRPGQHGQPKARRRNGSSDAHPLP